MNPLITASLKKQYLPPQEEDDPFYNNVVFLAPFDKTNEYVSDYEEVKGHALTVVGNVKPDSSQSNFGLESIYFDGNGDSILVANASDFDFYDDFTFECWFRTTSLTGTQCLISFEGANWKLGVNSNAYIFINTPGGGVYSTSTVSANTWCHIAWCRDVYGSKVYLNGTLVVTQNYSAPIDCTGVRFGDSSGFGWYLSGWMEEIRLTAGLIRYIENFTVPTAYFPSAGPSTYDPYYNYVTFLAHCEGANNSTVITDQKGHTLTVSGDAKLSTTQSKFGSTSLYSDGTGDYVSATSSGDFGLVSNDFTIEFWIKPNSVTSADSSILTLIYDSGNKINIWKSTVGAINAQFLSSGAQVAEPSKSGLTTNWQHVAVVRFGNKVQVYIDGVGGTPVIPTNLTFFSSATLSLGLGTGAYVNYAGYLDEVRITIGVCRYYHNFTVPSVPFLDDTVTAYDPYFDLVTLLLHCNGSNGSQSFTDQKGHTVVANGNVQTSTAQSKFNGSSLLSDGNGDYLSIAATSTEFQLGAYDFTIEFWIRITNNSTYQGIISNRNSTSGAHSFDIFIANSGTINCIFSNDGTNNLAVITGSIQLTTNVWHHVAITRRSDRFKSFIDGVDAGSSTGVGSIYASAGTLYVSSHGITDQPNGVIGNLADIRITRGISRYNGKFAVPTVAFPDSAPIETNVDPFFSNTTVLLRGHKALFEQRNHSLYSYGSPKLVESVYKFGNASIYFNGTTDYIEVPYSPEFEFEAGDFTVEFWLRPGDITGSRQIVGRWDWSVNRYWNIYQNATNLVFEYLYSSTPLSITCPTSYALVAGTWYHVAIVRHKSRLYFFKDGTLLGTGDMQNYAISVSYSTQPLRIGGYCAYNTTANYFKGYIDDLRITKGIARYTGNFSVPTAAHSTVQILSYDPFWNNVVLLSHFNSTNGILADFEDTKGHVLTPFGNPRISTSSKFGSGSGYFPNSYNAKLSTPTSSDFVFNGDLTFECWFRRSETGLGNRTLLASIDSNTYPNDTWQLYITNVSSLSKLVLNVCSGATRVARITGNTVIADTNWHHVALVRISGVFKLYLDGVQEGSSYSSAVTLIGTSKFYVGGMFPESTGEEFVGYLDEVRITKGIGRYASDFTVPTEAFPTNLTDDPYWSSVVLHLPFVKAATDVKGHYLDLRGNSKLSTAQARYGNASAVLDGTGDYILIDHVDFELGYEDFTLELWVKFNSLTGARYILDNTASSWIWLQLTNSVLSIYFLGSAFTVTPTLTAGQWYNIVLTRTAGTANFYLNGTLIDVKLGFGYTALGGQKFELGMAYTAGGSSSTGLDGYFDEIRLTRGVARYQAGGFDRLDAEFLEYGESVYDPFWNNVVLLMHFDNAQGLFVDKRKHLVTLYGNVQISGTQSKFGNYSALFDGNGDYLTVKATEEFNINVYEHFTIEMWVYRASSGTEHALLTRNVWYTGTGWMYLCIDSSGHFVAKLGNNGSGWYTTLTSSSTVATSTWTHLAISRSSDKVRIFINGVVEATATYTLTFYQSGIGEPIVIGSAGYTAHASNNYFNGYIDELRFTKGIARYISNFNVPTAAFLEGKYTVKDQYMDNVVLLMHMDGVNGSTTFTDVMGHTSSVSGNAQISTAQSKFGGASALLDGSGDYITYPGADFGMGTGDFTIEFFVRFSVIWTSTFVLGIGQASPSGLRIGFPYPPNGIAMEVNGASANSGSGVSINQWHHVACVRSGGYARVYLNGIGGIAVPMPNNLTAPANIHVGRADVNDSGIALEGYLDEVRITKGIARYTGDFAVPTNPFSND